MSHQLIGIYSSVFKRGELRRDCREEAAASEPRNCTVVSGREAWGCSRSVECEEQVLGRGVDGR